MMSGELKLNVMKNSTHYLTSSVMVNLYRKFNKFFYLSEKTFRSIGILWPTVIEGLEDTILIKHHFSLIYT